MTADFNVRGGVYTSVVAEHRSEGWVPAEPVNLRAGVTNSCATVKPLTRPAELHEIAAQAQLCRSEYAMTVLPGGAASRTLPSCAQAAGRGQPNTFNRCTNTNWGGRFDR